MIYFMVLGALMGISINLSLAKIIIAPTIIILIIMVSLIIIYHIICWQKNLRTNYLTRSCSVLLSTSVFFFLWTWGSQYYYCSWQVPVNKINQPTLALIRIDHLPLNQTHEIQVDVKLLTFDQKSVLQPTLIRLHWAYPAQTLHVGQTWQLMLKVKPNHGLSNPGSFNQEQFLYKDHIRATAAVYTKGQQRLLNYQQWSYPFTYLRELIAHYLQTHLPDTAGRGVLLALSVGEERAIAPAIWPVLQNTGTNHLVAVAGLHLGMITATILWLSGFFWRWIFSHANIISRQSFTALITVIILWFYALLVGFNLATERATIMISLYLIGHLLRIKIVPSRLLGCTMILALFLNPLEPLSFSFWLSFVGVWFLLQFSIRLVKSNNRHGLKSLTKMQGVIFIGLSPLMIFFFNEVALIGCCANLIAIPWLGIFIFPALFMGIIFIHFMPLVADTLLHLACNSADHLLQLLTIMANWSQFIYHPQADLSMVFILLIGAMLFIISYQWPGQKIAWYYFLPLCFPPLLAFDASSVELTVLDVGEGLATVLKTAGHVLVYDTGPKWGADSDAGSRVLIPYLYHEGIKHIDDLIISHSDADHSGGAQSLLKAFTVEKIYASTPNQVFPATAHWCLAGNQWDWDNIHFEFLYPLISQLDQDNNSSCVLKVSLPDGQAILFSGDIEKAAEKWLVQHKKVQLKSTVLIVPHHGSKTSSTPAFLDAVHPLFALFSFGYYNRFHFPHPTVLKRYLDAKIENLNTVTCGAINLKLLMHHLPIQTCWREQQRRYWQP